MSKVPSNSMLFSPKEFKEATLNDRLYMAIMNDQLVLQGFEQMILDRLERVFVILSEEKVPGRQVHKIMNIEGCSRTMAYKHINQCEQIFGRIRKVNREFQRNVEIERLNLLIDQFQRMSKFDLMLKCKKLLYEVIDFSREEEINVFESLELPTPVYTSDYSSVEEAEIVKDEEE